MEGHNPQEIFIDLPSSGVEAYRSEEGIPHGPIGRAAPLVITFGGAIRACANPNTEVGVRFERRNAIDGRSVCGLSVVGRFVDID